MSDEPVVFVISGDSKGRRNLSLRLKKLGCERSMCHSPEDFHQNSSPHDAGCILLHVTDPDADLEWLGTLGRHDDHWPVIGIAAEADVETAVRAMKRGAFDFLLETCHDRRLQTAVDDAFRWDREQRQQIARVQAVRRRLNELSPQLRDVLDLLVKGKSNREIADELGLSVRSIEVRRSKVMQTMKARTLATLVRQTLVGHGMSPAPSGSLSTHDGTHAGELDGIAPRLFRPAK